MRRACLHRQAEIDAPDGREGHGLEVGRDLGQFGQGQQHQVARRPVLGIVAGPCDGSAHDGDLLARFGGPGGGEGAQPRIGASRGEDGDVSPSRASCGARQRQHESAATKTV